MISKVLPEADHFVPVQPSKEPVDFASLRTIDLSRYDDGPEARAELAEEIRLAMTTQGFFTIINHGITEKDISRQVDIGHTILKRTPQEEKLRLKAPMIEEGSYHGFKPRGHWRNAGNVRDKVENFNVYRDMSLREQPAALKPFQPEIQSFIDYTHKDILYKLLRLFGIALKLDDEDYLVKAHDYNGHDETWLRYMEYYDEYTSEEKAVTGGLWLGGHQDFTSLSLLFSQPMSSLQVRDYDSNEWKYVKHVPGAIVVNAGETMLWWTGNYFKAAIHRVFEPPVDQRGHNRSSVFYFCVPNDKVVINTLLDKSPVLREAGVEMAHLPKDAPTSADWSHGRIKITGRNAVWDKKGDGANVTVERVGTVETKWFR
ncbi:Clavaminate synthase-like protein [Exophiala viscosa]|uniref:Clavaminate synthase-like protein n=1 Tax=Exophiala viscosa TaxID=2486360 RepID=A0AAN6DXT2_9EURO|nr:Clavaminate synthase-like protein [Exophiala viscosa]KAI1621281.1 Clavaminate synthase-like protein [Exophiala viscosa]